MTCILSINIYVVAKRRQRYYFFFTRAREKSKKVHFLERKRFRKQRSGSENWVNETFAKPLAKAKQTTATRRTTAVHRTANREVRVLLRVWDSFINILGGGFYHISKRFGLFVGYKRSIRRVFTEYSYVSGMCRVCIGYVSGTCRRVRGARGEVCQPRMSTDGHGKRNIDILARKLAEI